MVRTWKAGRFELSYASGEPLIMGIVNVTPDSFSDGGLYKQTSHAIEHARSLLDNGAQILDIGGESTRPGSAGVSAQEEWSRLADVLKELLTWNVPLSVDTMKTEVMAKAVDLGVDILNDVNGFREAGAFDGGFMRIHCPLVFAIVLNHVVKGEPQAPERQLE